MWECRGAPRREGRRGSACRGAGEGDGSLSTAGTANRGGLEAAGQAGPPPRSSGMGPRSGWTPSFWVLASSGDAQHHRGGGIGGGTDHHRRLGPHRDARLFPRTGVVPFVALLLLQRRPVAGRALLVTGPGCPGHGLCRSNVQEQTRKQVALLNATAQDLFSLYVSLLRQVREGGRPGMVAEGGRVWGWGAIGDVGVTLASPPS